MGAGLRPVLCWITWACLATLSPALAAEVPPPSEPGPSLRAESPTLSPVDITADRVQYLKERELYEAEGQVVITQGTLRLTADYVTINALTGVLTATGHAHLSDLTSNLWSERLQLNVNTNAGVVMNGRLHVYQTNTYVDGRVLQRFSETHFRAKDGSFTNCDAEEGQVPAWRFRFEDADVSLGDTAYLKGAWFCINDVPLVPIPTYAYPVNATRKSGFLIPVIGWDTVFGLHLRQSFFWAATPSQDLTITPDVMTKRGYGGDLEYRYMLNRRTSGKWLLNAIQDTTEDRARGFLMGAHVQQFNPNLSLRSNIGLVSDRTYLQNLSSSGVQRSMNNTQSDVSLVQRFSHGSLFAYGQYLQPLNLGGNDTFQRLPDIGHRLSNVAPLGGPALLSMDSTVTYWYRNEGFQLGRMDFLPGVSMDAINVGNVLGVLPQAKFRETLYSRGAVNDDGLHREAVWAAVEGSNRLVRRFRLGEQGSLLHTIEPRVVYEYSTSTSQGDISKIDDIDALPAKNLLTWSLGSRLLSRHGQGPSHNWLNLLVAQSYRLDKTTLLVPQFDQTPLVGTTTQPIIPAVAPVKVGKFSDIWIRAVAGDPIGPMLPGQSLSLAVDSFIDPYDGRVSQFNADAKWQYRDRWYVSVGQRYTQNANRPKRGDIWNTLSFNEVFQTTGEIQFLTASAALRLPFGWTLGARTYYDIETKQATETDVVALYQNPCRCWSLGLFYLDFPDRAQYNFVLSFTGLGFTPSIGSTVLQTILSPLLREERGLPWPSRKPQRAGQVEMAPDGAQLEPSIR